MLGLLRENPFPRSPPRYVRTPLFCTNSPDGARRIGGPAKTGAILQPALTMDALQ